eukprot:Gb_11195 [translate_table: standard]
MISVLHASSLKNSPSGASYDGSAPLLRGFDGEPGVDGSNLTGYFDGGGSRRGYFAKASHANLCYLPYINSYCPFSTPLSLSPPSLRHCLLIALLDGLMALSITSFLHL